MTPSEFYNQRVIGKIYSQLKLQVDGKDIVYPVEEHEVIGIGYSPNKSKIYVCNQWYKQGIAQLVPEAFVIKFESYFKDQYLFLDFDGVLNSDNYQKEYQSPYLTPDLANIDPKAVEVLNKVLDVYPNTNIVISSSWRNFHSLNEISQALKKKGFQYDSNIVGKTETLHNQKREEEILLFLQNKQVNKFVVLDDGIDLEKVKQNLVQTKMEDGLTDSHLSLILKLL